MSRLRVCLLSFAALATVCAADVTTPKATPTPAPPTKNAEPPAKLDPATAKKAEEAADAYLKQSAVRPDPLAETALAEIEVLLLEVHAFIDAKQPTKAGERYLVAIEKRKTIAEDQRAILGKRLVKADTELLSLTRQLLGQPAYDLGDPPADKPAAGAPAEKPAK
jgi:hypothetical protein